MDQEHLPVCPIFKEWNYSVRIIFDDFHRISLYRKWRQGWRGLFGTGLGHESLSIIFRFAQILLSALDPASFVRKLTSFRLSSLGERRAGVVLPVHQ